MAYSISVAKGKGSISHNTRKNIKNAFHVDKIRSHKNLNLLDEVYKQSGCKNQKEYMDKLLDEKLTESIIRTNPLKAKKDRFEGTGSEYVKQDSKIKKPFKEIIIQLGDQHDHPTEEQAIEFFKRYVDLFRKANPQIEVVGAYIHLDEKTPHLHLDVIGFYEKDCYERDENGEIIYQKTAKGKITKRPQPKYKRDGNGEIVMKEHRIKGEIVLKPEAEQFRGLDTYINLDEAILAQGLKSITDQNEKDVWMYGSDKSRFTTWRNNQAELAKVIAKELGLETKEANVKHKGVQIDLYKELKDKAILEASPEIQKMLVEQKNLAEVIEEQAQEQEKAFIEIDDNQIKTVETDMKFMEELFERPIRLKSGKPAIVFQDEEQFKKAKNRLSRLKTTLNAILQPLKTIKERITKKIKSVTQATQKMKEKAEQMIQDQSSKANQARSNLKQKLLREDELDLRTRKQDLQHLIKFSKSTPADLIELEIIEEILGSRNGKTTNQKKQKADMEIER